MEASEPGTAHGGGADVEAEALDAQLDAYAQLDDVDDMEADALLASPRALSRSTSLSGGTLVKSLLHKRPPLVAYVVLVPVLLLLVLLVVGAVWEFT